MESTLKSNTSASGPSKVTAQHLSRSALVYVRQSTARQVVENQESTRRQYGLRERALGLGWGDGQIETIDKDLGQSGASAVDRAGFQSLIAEVSMGRVGIVMGLEVSRLARNNSDWHRLLELCAQGDTLILDEDGLYNPSEFNDSLLLGLKGTISATELHVLRARLRGGALAKAKRGELRLTLPVGFVYDPLGRVVLHPDAAVQQAIRLFFDTYERLGAACATVKHFNRKGIQFPVSAGKGAAPGQVLMGRLNVSRAVIMLHNPSYAGAYFYGRARIRKGPNGKLRSEKVPRDQWHALIQEAHPGYITWSQFEANERNLSANDNRIGLDNKPSLAREGPALLQGLLLCGKCGRRMSIRYICLKGKALAPIYVCQRTKIDFQELPCQSMPGTAIDAAIGNLVVATMSPLATDMALRVHAELQSQQDQADRQRQRQVERVQYEVEVARQRYMQVDPGNRLVAATLEADWNDKLRALEQTRADVARQRQSDHAKLDDEAKLRLDTLSRDFAELWHDPNTPNRERKRLLALLIADVTLTRSDTIQVQVRFRGGTTTELTVAQPINAWTARSTHPQALAIMREIGETVSTLEIAKQLNNLGYLTGNGAPWSEQAVSYQCWRHHIGTHARRTRPQGTLTREQIMRATGVGETAVKRWRKQGKILGTTLATRHFAYLALDQQPEPIRQLVARHAAALASLDLTPILHEV